MRRLVLASMLALAACAAPRSMWRTSPLVGKSVEVAARDLDGHEVRMSRTGARLTVVDFWATWCDPCREQLPFLGQLAERYQPQGVEVYAVSFDEDRSAVEEFLARNPLKIPVLWDKGGATLAEKLDVTRLPTTLVLDAGGVVRAVHLGYERSQGAALEGEVRRLLAE